MVEVRQAPAKITPKGVDDYLEVLTKAVFQSGISWRVIDSKWSSFRKAFRDFDPNYVARLTAEDIEKLAEDRSIVRNRRKIEATVANAKRMLKIDEQPGGFQQFLRSHRDFESATADLVANFKYLGELGDYYFMWVVDEPVPSYEEWSASHNARYRRRK
jgi:3-methyladenine DNA glycosylase Tag